MARQQGWKGTITLRVALLPDGTVGQVDIVQSTGHQVLDEVAKHTVQQWKHDLLQQNSTSAAVWEMLNFTFALDKEG